MSPSAPLNPVQGGHPAGRPEGPDSLTGPVAPARPDLRRAVYFMTASSFLVPAAGLLTQPLFARALGVDGRGEMQAGLAPAALATAVATLGLPDALTYLTARDPRITRRAIAWASLLSVVLGLLCLAATWGLLPFLTRGHPRVASYMLVAMALAVPLLVVGALRGTAIGHQMWRVVATESLVSVSLRLIALVALFVAGRLTPMTAIVVVSVGPLVAGLVYWRLLLPQRLTTDAAAAPAAPGPVLKPLLSFGARVWFGSVASMLLSRTSQLLMLPLSSARDLGLFAVASTISDLPLLVALAAAGALMGVNAKSNDPRQVAMTTRLGILLGVVGCCGLAATVPFFLVPLFGSDFADALGPTLVLVAAALVCIPGLLTGGSLSAFGRPELRSAGLVVTVVVNLGAFVLLVPLFGVWGACWTSVIANLVLTAWNVTAASRVMDLRVRDFLLPCRADVQLAWREGQRLGLRVAGGLKGRD